MAAKLVLAVAAVLLCLQLAAAQKMIETPQPLFAWSSYAAAAPLPTQPQPLTSNLSLACVSHHRAPGSVSTEQRTISLAKLTLEVRELVRRCLCATPWPHSTATPPQGIVLRLVGRAELDLGVVYLIPQVRTRARVVVEVLLGASGDSCTPCATSMQLRTDRMRDGALPAVKAAVRGAQSSLILPYTTGSGITALLNLDATRFLLFGEPSTCLGSACSCSPCAIAHRHHA